MKELLYGIYVSSAVLSVLLMLIGMWWYSKETKKAKNRPNIVVLFLWAILAIVTAVTYELIVGDWLKSFLLFTGVASNIYVLVVLILHKNYILLKRDIVIIVLGTVLVTGFVLFMNIKEVHIIMQIINTLAYIPLIMGIMDDKGKEPLGPWMLIFIASIANLITIVVSYSDYWSLIQPLRSIFLQIVVMLLIKIKEIRTAPSGELFFYDPIFCIFFKMEYTYSIFTSLRDVMKKFVKKTLSEKTIFSWPKKNQLFTLMLCLAIPLLAGVIGSWFTMPAIDVRYLTLIKPVFTAPNRLFGPVWSILFLLMGISLFLVSKDGIQEKDKPAMRYFVIQLFLNILWSILFFYLQNPLLAFIEIIVFWIFILVTAYEFGKINKGAGWLFLPYILRVTFAAVLNYSIMMLN